MEKEICLYCGAAGQSYEGVFWKRGPGGATEALLGIFCNSSCAERYDAAEERRWLKNNPGAASRPAAPSPVVTSFGDQKVTVDVSSSPMRVLLAARSVNVAQARDLAFALLKACDEADNRLTSQWEGEGRFIRYTVVTVLNYRPDENGLWATRAQAEDLVHSGLQLVHEEHSPELVSTQTLWLAAEQRTGPAPENS